MPLSWSALELAAGWRFGHRALDLPSEHRSARQVLEEEILEALRRPPCVVQFSGGRDSSAILAVAVSLARRHGLPDPIVFTRTYPLLPAADEGSWPELVIRHLGVREWERVAIRHELDLLGPWATSLIRRQGPLWPPAAHSNMPALELARGGTVLTGEGGDTVFGPHRTSALRRLLSRKQRPDRRLARALWRSHAPKKRRRALLRAHYLADGRAAWLTEAAVHQFADEQAEAEVRQPLDWSGSMAWHLGASSWIDGYATLARIAADHDVRLRHPLSNPRFVSALAPIAGRLGFTSRADAMIAVFGDLLPDQVLRRTTKATFNASVVGPASRAFVEGWEGGDDKSSGYIRVDALKEHWLSEAPHPASLPMLAAAWAQRAPNEVG